MLLLYLGYIIESVAAFVGCGPSMQVHHIDRQRGHWSPAHRPLVETLFTSNCTVKAAVSVIQTSEVDSVRLACRMILLWSAYATSLTELFNLSISTSDVPFDWNIARIVPVPKGADQTQTSGYTPILILPVVSKIIEQHYY